MMELRFYSWVNWMLSPIQQGIQTGHAAVDLVRKYEYPAPHQSDAHIKLCKMVMEWSDTWKTFIILNGGDFKNTSKIELLLKDSGFPWIHFNESFDALNGITTCVGAVLPETIFNATLREPTRVLPPDQSKIYQYIDPTTSEVITYYPTHKHYPLIELLKSSRLAT